MEKNSNFTAIQTNEGFQVVFSGSGKKTVELTFDEVNQFAYRYTLAQVSGEEIEMNEKMNSCFLSGQWL